MRNSCWFGLRKFVVVLDWSCLMVGIFLFISVRLRCWWLLSVRLRFGVWGRVLWCWWWSWW